VNSRREVLRKVEVGVLAGLAIGLVGVFGYAFVTALGADVTKCTGKVAAGSSTGLVLAVIALAGFGTGHFVALARKWLRDAPALRDTDVVKTGGLLQFALAAFLTLAFVLLAYETYALANSAAAPPITSYVRCAASNSPALAAIASFAVTLLLGNWLWYPSK
jgi:hypothetical protein